MNVRYQDLTCFIEGSGETSTACGTTCPARQIYAASTRFICIYYICFLLPSFPIGCSMITI